MKHVFETLNKFILADSLKMDFKCLGRKDVIVINGGANDIDKNGNKMKRGFSKDYTIYAHV
jgi:hypothetical protein